MRGWCFSPSGRHRTPSQVGFLWLGLGLRLPQRPHSVFRPKLSASPFYFPLAHSIPFLGPDDVCADQAIAAKDIFTEVREGAFAKEALFEAEGLAGFAFQAFEEEVELCDFDGSVIEIDAVDVVEEDAFAFGDGGGPSSAARCRRGRRRSQGANSCFF